MFNKSKYLLAPAVFAVVMMTASASFAETVTKKTVTHEGGNTVTTETRWTRDKYKVPATGAYAMNFAEFDINGDRILSSREIGEILFKFYDTDNNEVIDNNEYEHSTVVTAIPAEKDIVVSYDFDGDGIADQTEYTSETFMQDTMLTRFDRSRNGMSPHEFTDMYFNEADIDNDKKIDLKEWQGSYIASIDRANKDKALFNK